MNWTEAEKALSANLEPKHVVKASGGNGPKGDYIEGWHAISEANRIFGYDGWSYGITSLSLVGEGKNAKGTDFVKYMAVIQVNVDNVARQDVGYGSGYGVDAHEGASKEAVTDALKRALRTFGNPFGLALYDKTKANVGENKPEVTEEEAAQKRVTWANSLANRLREIGPIDAASKVSEPDILSKIMRLKSVDPEAFKIIGSALNDLGVTIEQSESEKD